jgi:hypothetical protein
MLNSPLQLFKQAIVDQTATPFGLVSAFLQPNVSSHAQGKFELILF